MGYQRKENIQLDIPASEQKLALGKCHGLFSSHFLPSYPTQELKKEMTLTDMQALCLSFFIPGLQKCGSVAVLPPQQKLRKEINLLPKIAEQLEYLAECSLLLLQSSWLLLGASPTLDVQFLCAWPAQQL